ncbi:hypothetical protein [Thalassovita mediterranea]|uniref:Lipoprotein n=1 Tax=Thalassovita mediterranea TaxID=340021 RepID=A0A0P1H4W5_9RHOB|nr:hypothetical protein [Thalassovita mediterranea]MCG7573683.1 hypothetical protein [Phaeobacter sp. CNT1-3]CUH85874.1 hypothetical protein TM5383_03117 [Thalassovita mediterranea]SIS32702.1 hypothetical protein SAMN05421685_10768 [Thalassovita mediterranea]
MSAKIWILAAVAATGLSACGDTVGERALYGAGAGVATAAVIDGNIGAGAIAGAAANVAYCEAYPSRC